VPKGNLLGKPGEGARILFGSLNQTRLSAAAGGVGVAQAALETGWGKSIIHNSDGTSSHNLFNIKADRSWNGPVATARTLEYEQGAAVKVAAGFRSYTSFADSFRDYLHFLRSNPRYGEALQNTHDPVAYAQSLQAAGYATDPRYADKIMTIYGMNEVASAVG
jgi:flagellar protein FlgJ